MANTTDTDTDAAERVEPENSTVHPARLTPAEHYAEAERLLAQFLSGKPERLPDADGNAAISGGLVVNLALLHGLLGLLASREELI